MAKQHSPQFVKLVQQAKQNIREYSVQEVKQKLDAGEPFHLIDVREESEWARAHLPQAKHLSKGIIERDIEKTISDPDAQIVLYCGGGSRSALAADNLRRMGYRNAISMDGGFRGWREAGFPVEQD